jgi:ribosomal protein S27AE
MKQKSFTIYDVRRAGITLEPMRCIRCGKVGEVVYHQYIGDASCGYCGKWQLADKKRRLKKVV